MRQWASSGTVAIDSCCKKDSRLTRRGPLTRGEGTCSRRCGDDHRQPQFPKETSFSLYRAKNERIEASSLTRRAEPKKGAPRSSPTGAAEKSSPRDVELRPNQFELDARGTRAEVQFLEEKYQTLRALADAEEWRERKQEALLQTSAPGFWDSPNRFAVLGLAEYMDRIEAGLDTAGSLLSRLTNGAQRSNDRQTFLPELVFRVAQRSTLTPRPRLQTSSTRDEYLRPGRARTGTTLRMPTRSRDFSRR